jgi:hypothetical protein
LREVLNRRRAGNYEYWVSDQHAGATAEAAFRARYLSSPIGFDPALFTIVPPPGEAVARVPVARLIDADVYNAQSPDPNVTLSGPVGLAEFANANFFSEDTLDGQFPFPRREGLVRESRPAPGSANVRAYFSKPAGQGLPTAVAMAECVSDRWIVGRSAPYACVDEAVWEETATHMLPRAVGYARGVLDYFFRGRLKVVQVGDGEGGFFIDIENTSNEPMDGVFEVHGRYQKGTPTEFRRLVSVLNQTAVTIGPGGDERFPLQVSGAATPHHVLVFRGRLGGEEGAVAGQVFSVPLLRIEQASYEADAIPGVCWSDQAPPGQLRRQTNGCVWEPVNHRVRGTFISNLGEEAGGDGGVIEVEAYWVGFEVPPIPAALTIDGVPGMPGPWTRPAGAPQPREFLVTDPAPREGAPLMITVTLTGGTRVSTQLVTFLPQVAQSSKHLNSDAPGQYVLSTSRAWWVQPNIDPDHATVVSVGGYPVPTSAVFDQISLAPPIWGKTVEVFEDWRGVAVGNAGQLLGFTPPMTLGDAIAAFNGSMLESRFFPALESHLPWRAVVRPKPGAPNRRLWNAFGGEAAPPLRDITLTARALEEP